jgi:hypothetical protein
VALRRVNADIILRGRETVRVDRRSRTDEKHIRTRSAI